MIKHTTHRRVFLSGRIKVLISETLEHQIHNFNSQLIDQTQA